MDAIIIPILQLSKPRREEGELLTKGYTVSAVSGITTQTFGL